MKYLITGPKLDFIDIEEFPYDLVDEKGNITTIAKKNLDYGGDFEYFPWNGYQVIHEYSKLMNKNDLRHYTCIFDADNKKWTRWYNLDNNEKYKVYELNSTQRLADPYPKEHCVIKRFNENEKDDN